MKTLIAMAALALMVGITGCGDDDNTNKDMGMSMVDMHVPGGESCQMVITCLQGCTNETCAGACLLKGSTDGKTQASALLTCVAAECLSSTDGGAASCSSAFDKSQACTQCQAAARSGACSTQNMACK